MQGLLKFRMIRQKLEKPKIFSLIPVVLNIHLGCFVVSCSFGDIGRRDVCHRLYYGSRLHACGVKASKRYISSPSCSRYSTDLVVSSFLSNSFFLLPNYTLSHCKPKNSNSWPVRRDCRTTEEVGVFAGKTTSHNSLY